jgi:pimeloyl-ACP methyl ester carboxylesterase
MSRRLVLSLLLGALLGSAVGLAPSGPVAGQESRPASAAFWVGEPPMYVERLEPADGARQPLPLVLVHGAGQTGASYLATPDGREGWAPYFVRRGFTTYVVDLPGHGRSGLPASLPAWSGLRYVEALEALLDQTGPALLLTHSMGGRVGWKLAERSPQRIAALFAVAPAPPPNLLPQAETSLPEDTLFFADPAFTGPYLTDTPTFPREALGTFLATLVPESARAVNEGRNAAGPELYVGRDALRGIPAAALAFDRDVADPPSIVQATAEYFDIPFLLADRDWGLPGHGHMAMLERGNLELAARVADWLEATGLRSVGR